MAPAPICNREIVSIGQPIGLRLLNLENLSIIQLTESWIFYFILFRNSIAALRMFMAMLIFSIARD